MDETHNYETITYKTFSELLDSYKELVPSKLDELEKQRLEIIPKSLSERTDDAHLKKPEVQKLVDWKLYVESVELFPSRNTKLTTPCNPSADTALSGLLCASLSNQIRTRGWSNAREKRSRLTTRTTSSGTRRWG